MRSFDVDGYPWITGITAVLFLGFAGYVAYRQVMRLSIGFYVDEGAVLVALPALLIGAVCAWFAVGRVLRGYDSAFEIDTQRRAVLVHTKSEATAQAIPFQAIQAVAISGGTTRYTHGGQLTGLERMSGSVVLLPMNVSLIHYTSDNAVGRQAVVSQTSQVARTVAATLGVPLIG